MVMSHPISVGKLQTKLTQFMSPVGLLIDEILLEGGPIFINTDVLENSQGEVSFEAIVRNQSIEVFLENLAPAGLHSFSVAVSESGIGINAVKTVLVPIPAKANAMLTLDSADSLSIELISAEALGAGLKNVVANQLAELNPIVTSDIFPVPVQFQRVVHTDGEVRIYGVAVLKGDS